MIITTISITENAAGHIAIEHKTPSGFCTDREHMAHNFIMFGLIHLIKRMPKTIGHDLDKVPIGATDLNAITQNQHLN